MSCFERVPRTAHRHGTVGLLIGLVLLLTSPFAAAGAAIAADVFNTVGLKNDGSIWAWGDNGHGQLGDGTNTGRSTPVPVSGLSNVLAIASGTLCTVALKNDGTVWAWGSNDNGQLGDGTTADRWTPVPVSGLSNVFAIAACGHTVALKSDGTVWAWGRNDNGQLGDGTTTNRSTPVPVSGLSNVLAIASGYSYTVALKTDGMVWAWGDNGFSQLGDGTFTDRWAPVPVSGLNNALAIAAGDVHTVALKSDGTIWAWGWNDVGQLGDGTTTNRLTPVPVSGLSNVFAIAAGGYHTVALKTDGTVWAWGSNDYGQLGDGTTTNRSTPVPVSGLSNVLAIASGGHHTVALKTDGTVWAWGWNVIGQLGDGTTTDRWTPVQVHGVGDVGFLNLLGTATTYALSVTKAGSGSGTVGGGGSYAAGATVTLTATPAAGSTFTGWSPSPCAASFSMPANNLACTATFTATATTYPLSVTKSGTGSGTVSGGGSYAPGATVNLTATANAGSTFSGWSPSPCANSFAMPAQALNCTATFTADSGTSYTLTVRREGSGKVRSHDSGTPRINCGTDCQENYAANALITLTATPAVGSVFDRWSGGCSSAGTSPTCAIAMTGAQRVTATFRPQAAKLATTGGNAFSVMNAGTGSAAYAVGLNNAGQLGNPTSAAAVAKAAGLRADDRSEDYSWFPEEVWWPYQDGFAAASSPPTAAATGSPNFKQVVSSSAHTLALRDNGEVWAWGSNEYGQLGDGTTINRDQPVRVRQSATSSDSLPNAVALAVGKDHSVAVLTDGTVWSWGSNLYGQLGNNSARTSTPRPYPVQVLAGDSAPYPLIGVIAVAASDSHTLALDRGGAVWAWGDNSRGQLGTGGTAYRTTATPVDGFTYKVLGITARGSELPDTFPEKGFSSRNLAELEDGSLWGWGDNRFCQLGDQASLGGQVTTPQRLPSLNDLGEGLSNLANGDYHGVLRKTDGTVWTWGLNNNGQLGNGASSTTPTCQPIQVLNLSDIMTVGAGRDHTLTTKRDGTVWGWGGNDWGQLGVGDTNAHNTPVQMKGVGGNGYLNLGGTLITTGGSAVGAFRNGEWFLDANGNGAWDGCGTEFCFSGFGAAGDLPASGNWDGGKKSYIGVLRSGTGEWFIDRNGNRQWDGCVTDGCYWGFGAPGDLPVAGDWNGTGYAKIGVFRNGQWFLDANGNGQWDGCGTELCLSFGQAGDLPAAGNWDGGLKAGVAVFRAGTWYLDYNGNGQWDGCDVDRCYVGAFGQAGDLPTAGDWNGDGKAKVGVFRAGTWFLDYNGNGAWDGCGTDRCYEGSFGQAGDLPVAGKW